MSDTPTGVNGWSNLAEQHGYRSSPRVGELIAIVCEQLDISVEALRGTGQKVRLVRARAIVASLAAELWPRLPASAVDASMLRGSGWCIWSRSRHDDRIREFPSYGLTYGRCRQAALAKFK